MSSHSGNGQSLRMSLSCLALTRRVSAYCISGVCLPSHNGFAFSQREFAFVGATQVQVTYPSLADMAAYIQSRHAPLKQAASTARGSLDMTKPLPLSHKAYLALITFLRQCRSKQKTQPDSPPQDYLGHTSGSGLSLSAVIVGRGMTCLELGDIDLVSGAVNHAAV